MTAEIWWGTSLGTALYFGPIAMNLWIGVFIFWCLQKVARFASNELHWFWQKRRGPTRITFGEIEMTLWVHRDGRVETSSCVHVDS